jgi:hypothetical protein
MDIEEYTKHLGKIVEVEHELQICKDKLKISQDNQWELFKPLIEEEFEGLKVDKDDTYIFFYCDDEMMAEITKTIRINSWISSNEEYPHVKFYFAITILQRCLNDLIIYIQMNK